ncbi:MAG: alcohol dehydrogenase catalytic domain-containing protein [Actinomycetota bacterium]|nr:alcohol dehydrogenase catalytic domain-containing protein [Actinomycetota bacterium]
MSITAVAPRFDGDGKITFVEHEYRDPGRGELLLRVEANAICGTDRAQYYEGSDVVPGHEAVGSVIANGADTATPIGTRGAVFLMDYCGTCRSCRLGATNQCLAKRADMGFTSDGGYGPYEIVHESNFFPVGDDVTAVSATLLLDVMGTSGHAIERARLVRKDIESVYIAGAGPIGLGLLLAVRLRLGADVPVHVSDLSEWRRSYAADLGGEPIDPAVAGALPEADIAFDTTGKESARRTCLDCLSQRGALICVGHGETVTLDVSADLIAPERAMLGSEYFRYDEMPENLSLLRAHPEEMARAVTHTVPVEQLPEAFELFLGGQTAKVVVTQETS